MPSGKGPLPSGCRNQNGIETEGSLCRVPGRAKRRCWVREGDYVIVEPWDIQGDERGDIIWKYKEFQVEHLKKRGALEGI